MKKKISIKTSSPDETKRVAFHLAPLLKEGDIILFLANLGSGKTTFTQGFIKGLGIREEALSPTFVLVESWEGQRVVHHLDFYRLGKKEILAMGIQDYLLGQGEIKKGIVLIEWAERCPEIWPEERIEIRIRPLKSPNERLIEITGLGSRFSTIVESLLKEEI